MLKISRGQCKQYQVEVMSDLSLETIQWMKSKGVKLKLTLNKFYDEERSKELRHNGS